MSLLGACRPGVIAGDTDPGDSDSSAVGSSSTSTDPDGGSDATSVADSGSEETDGPSACGNGIVDPGEECDEVSSVCREDCLLACSVEETFVADLQDPSRLLFDIPPRPASDGSGDFVVAMTRGASRITAAGDNVWTRTSAPGAWTAGRWTTGLVLVGDGTLWRTGESSPFSYLGRYDATTGDELFSVELGGGPGGALSLVRGLALAPDGGVITQRMILIDEDTRVVRIERHSPDGTAVEWTTDLIPRPIPSGPNSDAGQELVLSSEGEIYSIGRDYLDADSDEPLVVKLDSDGAILWRRTFLGGNITANSTAIAGVALDDGEFIAIGQRQEFGVPSVGSIPQLVQTIVRFDEDGGTVWDNDPTNFSGEGHVQLNGIRRISNDVVAFAGTVLYPATGEAVFGYFDATDGSLRCMTSVSHPSTRLNLGESVFVAADGSPMMMMGADDLQTDNFESEGRWIARLRPWAE